MPKWHEKVPASPFFQRELTMQYIAIGLGVLLVCVLFVAYIFYVGGGDHNKPA